jgi:ABC-type proline/glycine betaine transport system ATPase subunit
MTPAAPDTPFAGHVTAETKIEDLAAQVVDQDAPVAVTNGAGAVIGQLTREAVLDVLVRRPGPNAGPDAGPDADSEGEGEA